MPKQLSEAERAELRLLSQAKQLPDGRWIYGQAAVDYRRNGLTRFMNAGPGGNPESSPEGSIPSSPFWNDVLAKAGIK